MHGPLNVKLRQKLIIIELVKKFPAFYEAGKFMTVLINARHLTPILRDIK